MHHRLIDVGTDFDGVDSFEGLFFKTGRAMLGIAAVAAEVPRPRTRVGHLVGIAISAREQGLIERAVGQDADILGDALRLNLKFDGAPQETVRQLIGVVTSALQHVGHVERPKVANPYDTDLAGTLKLQEAIQRVCTGDVSAGPMYLIQIDIVGAQALEAALAGSADIVRRQVASG